MTEFLLAGGLVSLLALSFFLIPWLRHRKAVASAKRHWLVALMVVLTCSAAVGGLYTWLGSPIALNPLAYQRMPTDLKQAVAQLTRRMQAEPERLDGWMLLGRSQARLGNATAALRAFTQALRLAPDNPDVLTGIAEATAQGREDHAFAGQPRSWLEKALTLAPDHQRALWLAGVAATQVGAVEQAREHWSHLLSLLPPNSEIATTLKQQMQRFAPSPVVKTASSTRIQVKVSLGGGLAETDFSGWTVFVLAREPGGGRMPLAVRRIQVTHFPFETELSDAMVMLSGRSLAKAGKLEIVARLSKSGTALPQPGDHEGIAKNVDPSSTEPVQISIRP